MIKVSCDEHDVPLERDPVMYIWKCPQSGCTTATADEELARLGPRIRDHEVRVV